MEGVTSRQGMLTPSPLIPAPVYPQVRVSPFISLTCNSFLCLDTDHSLVSLIAIIHNTAVRANLNALLHTIFHKEMSQLKDTNVCLMYSNESFHKSITARPLHN
jgi:hypothetical protein